MKKKPKAGNNISLPPELNLDYFNCPYCGEKIKCGLKFFGEHTNNKHTINYLFPKSDKR